MANQFLPCEITREMQLLVLCLFGVSGGMPNSFIDSLPCWKDILAREPILKHGSLFGYA